MSCAHIPNRLRNRGIEQVITLVRRPAARIPAKTEDIMKLRASIAAIGTAVALGGTGAFLLPTAANAHAMTHTLRFTAVQQATANFSKTIGGAADKDVNKAGKVIGYDVLRFSFNPKTNTTTIGVALDTKGGFLYGVLRESNGPVSRGRVTGGTGIFHRAAGTITARALGSRAAKGGSPWLDVTDTGEARGRAPAPLAGTVSFSFANRASGAAVVLRPGRAPGVAVAGAGGIPGKPCACLRTARWRAAGADPLRQPQARCLPYVVRPQPGRVRPVGGVPVALCWSSREFAGA